jgi:adenylate kinase family enzyme
LVIRRIVVVGRGASGKTILARRIGERTGLPVICLDAIWQGLGPVKDVAAFRALLAEAHAPEGWISEGNFARATFDLRLPRAQLIVWLEKSRILCTWRALLRTLRRGEYNPGGLTAVLSFIWNFDRVNRPQIEAERMASGADVPVLRLRSQREIADFVSSF